VGASRLRVNDCFPKQHQPFGLPNEDHFLCEIRTEFFDLKHIVFRHTVSFFDGVGLNSAFRLGLGRDKVIVLVIHPPTHTKTPVCACVVCSGRYSKVAPTLCNK